MRENNRRSRGVNFLELLLLLFIGLKLTGVIEWGWVWVLSPVWIPLSLVLVVLAALFFSSLIDYID